MNIVIRKTNVFYLHWKVLDFKSSTEWNKQKINFQTDDCLGSLIGFILKCILTLYQSLNGEQINFSVIHKAKRGKHKFGPWGN